MTSHLTITTECGATFTMTVCDRADHCTGWSQYGKNPAGQRVTLVKDNEYYHYYGSRCTYRYVVVSEVK
jgi:hypothetical protein